VRRQYVAALQQPRWGIRSIDELTLTIEPIGYGSLKAP
jgi:hypothetical protein